MSTRWQRRHETDNDGRALVVSVRGDYEICQHVAVYSEGKFIRWDFEVTKREGRGAARVGLARSLPAAKKLAREHSAKEES